MRLVPVTITEARRFVGRHHRHNPPPVGGLFAVGVADDDGGVVGVAVVGRPVARMFQDGFTAEVTRTCTTGAENANSMLYGACARAAKALGYERLYTYTLASEPGTSLRAAGWVEDGELPANREWGRGQRPRYQQDLFGNQRRPLEAKVRWVKQLRQIERIASEGKGKV